MAPDRPPFLGTSGFGPLDNISVLERFEEGARRWSAARGGSVVELHAYALVEQPVDQQLKDQLLAELHRIYPELEPAGIVAEEFLIMNDCPLHGTDPWDAAAHRGDAAPADRAGRRRHSVRLSGRTDGACCYDRLPRCQPAP